MGAKDTVMSDEQLEDRLHQIAQADIGFDARRLTKCRIKHETPCGWEEYYEPTPIEYAREVAHAQAEITRPIAYKAGHREAQDGIWDKVMGAKKSGFDEGKQEGIREVVEQIRKLWKPRHHNLCYGIIHPHPDCVCCKWLAFLKEKGIRV